MKALTIQILKSIGCCLSGIFFGILGAAYFGAANWLLAGIFFFFAFCGAMASILMLPLNNTDKTEEEHRQ